MIDATAHKALRRVRTPLFGTLTSFDVPISMDGILWLFSSFSFLLVIGLQKFLGSLRDALVLLGYSPEG
jgi:hypothetical protein